MRILNENVEKDELRNRIKQEELYMEYIKEHINNVEKAYYNLLYGKDIILPIEYETKEIKEYSLAESNRIILELRDIIKEHDDSKYSDDEFSAYRRKFFPTDKEKNEQDTDILKMVDEDFDNAWKHHYLNNCHHSKFYLYNKINERDGFGVPISWETSEIPLTLPQRIEMVSILHMICDWEAMSIKFGGNTIDWYINKAKDERSYMNPGTRKVVEQVLELIFNTKLPSSEEIDVKDKENK